MTLVIVANLTLDFVGLHKTLPPGAFKYIYNHHVEPGRLAWPVPVFPTTKHTAPVNGIAQALVNVIVNGPTSFIATIRDITATEDLISGQMDEQIFVPGSIHGYFLELNRNQQKFIFAGHEYETTIINLGTTRTTVTAGSGQEYSTGMNIWRSDRGWISSTLIGAN